MIEILRSFIIYEKKKLKSYDEIVAMCPKKKANKNALRLK